MTGVTGLPETSRASSCSAKWEDMTGDDRARFCGRCKLHVYNVAELRRPEFDRLILEHEGTKLCVRMFLRRDGTALTRDCPRGVLRKVLIWSVSLVVGTLVVAWIAGKLQPPPFIGTRF